MKGADSSLGCPSRQSRLIGCMSFGVKSLLTPDKVGPGEASDRIILPGSGLVQAGASLWSPWVGLLSVRWCPTCEKGTQWPGNSTVLITCLTEVLVHFCQRVAGRRPPVLPEALGLVSAIQSLAGPLGLRALLGHTWKRGPGATPLDRVCQSWCFWV